MLLGSSWSIVFCFLLLSLAHVNSFLFPMVSSFMVLASCFPSVPVTLYEARAFYSAFVIHTKEEISFKLKTEDSTWLPQKRLRQSQTSALLSRVLAIALTSACLLPCIKIQQ